MAKRITNQQIADACGCDIFMVARVVTGSNKLNRRRAHKSRSVAKYIAAQLGHPVSLVFPDWRGSQY